MNHSFSVHAGPAQYHLKITDDPDSVQALRQWHAVHTLLEARYRAPKLIGWVDFPEIGFAGLLFERVTGESANFANNRALLEQLMALTGCLHQDKEILSHLTPSRPGRSYLQHFVETYIDRFTGDLETVAAGRLPFVSPALVTWMQNETGRLYEAASLVPAFQKPALEAVHGDLSEANIIVAAEDWFVLDWDDLALGDPAVEFAVLLWPMVREGARWRDFFRSAMQAGFAERLDVCFRAQLLDEVIDSLADYVEARAVPSQQEAVQLMKRKGHEEALEKYRMTWRG